MSASASAGRPRATVLMPVYNGAKFLRLAIDSVLGQTFADLELLVVDDASTDETPSILAGCTDARLRVLRNERNLGLTPTLNRGIREARGALIARQDADDLSDPGRLEVQIAHLDAHPEVALLGCAYRRIDESGLPGGIRQVPTDATSIRWRLLFLSAFAHSSIVMRAEVLEDVGPYDEAFRYAQDYELWSRISRNHEVAAVPETLVSYRRTGSSLTATYDGAGAEVDAISADNVERVLAALPPALSAPPRIDRGASWPLLFGDAGSVDPARARRAAPRILDLQLAFAIAVGLDAGEAARHRRTVGRILARRLTRLGLRNGDARTCLAGLSAFRLSLPGS